MAKQIVHLIFPQNLIKEPAIYTMAKKYDIIPNVRRAKITEEIGEVTLELDGTRLLNVNLLFPFEKKSFIFLKTSPITKLISTLFSGICTF